MPINHFLCLLGPWWVLILSFLSPGLALGWSMGLSGLPGVVWLALALVVTPYVFLCLYVCVLCMLCVLCALCVLYVCPSSCLLLLLMSFFLCSLFFFLCSLFFFSQKIIFMCLCDVCVFFFYEKKKTSMTRGQETNWGYALGTRYLLTGQKHLAVSIA